MYQRGRPRSEVTLASALWQVGNLCCRTLSGPFCCTVGADFNITVIISTCKKKTCLYLSVLLNNPLKCHAPYIYSVLVCFPSRESSKSVPKMFQATLLWPLRSSSTRHMARNESSKCWTFFSVHPGSITTRRAAADKPEVSTLPPAAPPPVP